MTIKKRKFLNLDDAIENLANELADKPYGNDAKEDNIARTTITIPAHILFELEDIARNNKRKKKGPRSVSAIIRDCLEKQLKK